MTRTYGWSAGVTPIDGVPIRAVDGRARSIDELTSQVTRKVPPARVRVMRRPGNDALRQLAESTPLRRIRDVVERGPIVTEVQCAPLDRLVDIAEIGPIEEAFRRVLGSGRFTAGPDVERIEHALGMFLGVDHVVGSASGTDALVGALLAVGVRPGDEVIIPPNSFPGTENAVHITGATPVLADTRDDHLIDPESVRAVLTSRTRCVLPVHLYGRFADVRALSDICAPHGIPIVEDAAQGIGLDDVGRWSDAAALSFNPYKNLGACGKAGAVVTNRADLAEEVRRYLYHGFTPVGSEYRKYLKSAPFGLNARIDNLQAAGLGARVGFLSRNNLRRSVLAARYLDSLDSLAQRGLLRLPAGGPDTVWHLFTVEETIGRRDELLGALARRGVQADVYYPVLTHRQGGGASVVHDRVDLRSVEGRSAHLFQLPLYPTMTLSEQDRVVDALYAAFAS
ncbi:DegT/DnrJ/EryC1/StrS family aminotransferase [Gordonia soli]|uniref:Putative aminotransferase n=1 Tax=Gordonia soli NBRC 108243 TaxID=1223545 RepID=M0QN97_9ACTN|nr:DegT/DnrJ/EryC1/StrS family aminotransferase [Gordonia soli]GAC69859.1 putative aminotransferase [Gordonia soli NBRC 108243]